MHLLLKENMEVSMFAGEYSLIILFEMKKITFYLLDIYNIPIETKQYDYKSGRRR